MAHSEDVFDAEIVKDHDENIVSHIVKLRSFGGSVVGDEFWPQTEVDDTAFWVEGAMATSDESVESGEKRVAC